MAGCPFRNFEECPEHNRKGGCALWMSYSGSKDSMNTSFEGCAFTLAPMLLMEQANVTGMVAGEISKVGAEVSAARCENIEEGRALRKQFYTLASGKPVLVEADHSRTMQAIKGAEYGDHI